MAATKSFFQSKTSSMTLSTVSTTSSSAPSGYSGGGSSPSASTTQVRAQNALTEVREFTSFVLAVAYLR
ncbi:hypothetical protein VNO78_19055 [Psophocarpus tetragonolobus]|uniref:Uncharacterized protein n=1 Tax=Psophocarpus tetragonolobus TaxID=3891 RepID=A0AAN9S7S7_PSOTE